MSEMITQLSQLLSDEDFMKLDKNLSAFNTFEVLKLSNHEIRHSNVLAWLFNPNESHNLGTLFFKQFLYHLASDEELDSKKQKKIKKIILAIESQNISDIKVYREYNVTVQHEKKVQKRFIDLLLKCSLSSEKDDLIILIENKFFAKQSENQLDDYLEYIAGKFGKPNKENELSNIIPVYLTKDGEDEPEGNHKDEYFHLTYDDILEILESLTAIKSANNSEAEFFIEQYKKTLEEYLGMNEEEIELAKAIYKNHKEAIDFIMGNINEEYPLVEAGNRFLNDPENKIYKLCSLEKNYDKSRGRFQFCDEILKSTKDGDITDWRGGALCGYFFQLKPDEKKDDDNGNLHFYIEVGPFKDIEKRKEFINICEKAGFTNRHKDKYTTIFTSEVEKIENMTNEDELYVAMKTLFTKQEVQEKIKKLHECVDEYEKRISEQN